MLNALKRFLNPAAPKPEFIFPRLFISDAHQRDLEAKGYVVIDLLNAGQVESLTAFYNALEHRKSVNHVLEVAMLAADYAYAKKISDHIQAYTAEALDRFFCNYKTVIGNFIVKHTGEGSYIYPHQDWTLVDETQYCTINVWTVLSDTNAANGTLGVIPGSHKAVETFRGTGIKTSLDGLDRELIPYVEFISRKAGQAIAYDVRLLHASQENRSPLPRIATTIAIAPQPAQLLHYYKAGEHEPINIYEVEKEYFLTNDAKKLASEKKPIGQAINKPFTIKEVLR
jgi:hypothetical protein